MNAITSLRPVWGPLTRELEKSGSPLAAYFKQRYPNVKGVKQRLRDSAGPLVINSAGADSSTLGTAFDWATRFALHPQPSPELAVRGVRRRSPALAAAATDMLTRMGVTTADEYGHLGIATFHGPVPGSTLDHELLLRGCWALAPLTDVYRIGQILPRSPLTPLDRPGVSADDLLALATQNDLNELGQLHDLAATRLLPQLTSRHGLYAPGPTFDGSKLIPADADLITASLLVELKTGLGDKRSGGTRRAALDTPELYQILAYALLDFTDQFEINTLGLYSARYGHLAQWPLTDLLEELTGVETGLTTERQALQTLLQTRRR